MVALRADSMADSKVVPRVDKMVAVLVVSTVVPRVASTADLRAD